MIEDATGKPEEYPFGKSEYMNYNPSQVNTSHEVVEVLIWLANENRSMGNIEASCTYQDAADLVKRCLVDVEEDTNK